MPKLLPSTSLRRVVLTSGVMLLLPQCFHRFADPLSSRGSARDEGGAGGEGGESGSGGVGGSSVGGGGSGSGTDHGSGGGGSAGAAGAVAGRTGGTSGPGGSGSGGESGSAAGAASANGGDGSGAAGEGAGGSADVPAEKPQCAIGGSAPEVVLDDDFETYSLGAPYGQSGSPWVRAVEGRVGTVSGAGAYSGAQSFELASYTTSPEVAYATLGLSGPPRRVIVELHYAPDGSAVYKDFAEFGLARAASKFDLRPTVALEVNDHVLELRAAPEKPIASSNGHGPYAAAGKPPFVVLFDEVEYASDGTAIDYFRIDFDLCADTVSAYVGVDADAPLVGTGSFDGSVLPDSVYLAGGLNSTFVDDVRVLVDD